MRCDRDWIKKICVTNGGRKQGYERSEEKATQPPTKCIWNGADKKDILLFVLLSDTSYT